MNQTSSAFRSSGDLLADRRYAYAKAAVDDEDYAEAVDILLQVLELTPHWPPALFLLGIAEDKLSHRAEAIEALERAAELDTRDELGARLQLARLGALPAPHTAGQAYVQRLFDQYAVNFERHLLGPLAYRGPALLHAAVTAIQPRAFSHIIDLGCGTGLCGAAFRERTQTLCGVDLSPGMIEEARAKAIYDRLVVSNVEAFLATEGVESADLLLAADVLVYIGELTQLFALAARVLIYGGLFAFTVQVAKDGFQLGPDLRFGHAPNYIKGQAANAGLRIVSMESAAARLDEGPHGPGLILVAQKS